MIKSIFFIFVMTSLNALIAGQILDENGNLKSIIQENGDDGFIILDQTGEIQSYIQRNGDNGYMILDTEGKSKGFYQE